MPGFLRAVLMGLFSFRIPISTIALLLSISVNARADVWGFVDTQGITHVAATQVDDRYTLFYRAPQLMANDAFAHSPLSQVTETRPVLSPKLAEFFESSPRYRQVQPLLKEASRTYRIDIELLKALIATESAFNSNAVSPKGAIGLMQLMPDTARRFGIESDRWSSIESKLANPAINVQTGSKYLRLLMDMFPDQLDLALAAYNAGEGAVQRAGNMIPNFKETQAYVLMVRQIFAALKPDMPNKSFATRPIEPQFKGSPLGGATGRGNMLPRIQALANSQTNSNID